MIYAVTVFRGVSPKSDMESVNRNKSNARCIKLVMDCASVCLKPQEFQVDSPFQEKSYSKSSSRGILQNFCRALGERQNGRPYELLTLLGSALATASGLEKRLMAELASSDNRDT